MHIFLTSYYLKSHCLLTTCFCLGAQKSRDVPASLLLSIIAAWTREMLDLVHWRTKHHLSMQGVGLGMRQVSCRTGMEPDRAHRGWGLVLCLIPRYFSNFLNAWRVLLFVLVSLYSHLCADVVLTVVPPSTSIKTHLDMGLTVELQTNTL